MYMGPSGLVSKIHVTTVLRQWEVEMNVQFLLSTELIR